MPDLSVAELNMLYYCNFNQFYYPLFEKQWIIVRLEEIDLSVCLATQSGLVIALIEVLNYRNQCKRSIYI